MKRKVYKIISIILLFVICANLSIYAEDEINISIDRDTNQVTVSGVLPNSANSAVSITQLKPNVNAESLKGATNNNITEYIDYADAQIADADGEFSFSFINNGIDGKYTIKIVSLNKKYSIEKTYDFSGHAVQVLKDDINNAKQNKNVEKMEELLKTAYGVLDINSEVYDETVGVNSIKDNYIKIMAKILVEIPVIAKISDFVPQFTDSALIARTNIFVDGNDFEQFIDKYDSEAGIKSSTAYSTYDNSAIKEDIKKHFIGSGDTLKYKSLQEFISDFEKSTILLSISKSNGWADVKKVLSDNQNLIKDTSGNIINIAECERLSNPEKVYKALERKTYSTLSELKLDFDKLVAEAKADKPNPGPSGGGGGGGGGGGSASSIPVIDTVYGKTETNSIFSDLGNYAWAKDCILKLYDKKIVVGNGDGKFAPEKNVTRSEFVKMLIMAVNLYNADSRASFADISESDWQYSYVSSAYNSNIIALDDSKIFGANRELTREDMAAMCFRTIKTLGLNVDDNCNTTGFDDENMISGYALNAVAYLKSIGVINGMSDRVFAPKEALNRAQAAVVIEHIMNLTGGLK